MAAPARLDGTQIWRGDALGAHTGGYRQVPPLLAVEIAGQLDTEELLRAKASWYLDRGVSDGMARPTRVASGLAPDVQRLFRQLD